MRLGPDAEFLAPAAGGRLDEYHAHVLLLDAVAVNEAEAWRELIEKAFLPFHEHHGEGSDPAHSLLIFTERSGEAVLTWGKRRRLTWSSEKAGSLHFASVAWTFSYFHKALRRWPRGTRVPTPGEIFSEGLRQPGAIARILANAGLPPVLEPPPLPAWDPHLLTWREWSERAQQRLAEYRRAVMAHADLHGSVAPARKDREHFDWLALYQVGGRSFTRIAKQARRSRQTVEEAVKGTASLVGLSLREPTKGGRPRARIN